MTITEPGEIPAYITNAAIANHMSNYISSVRLDPKTGHVTADVLDITHDCEIVERRVFGYTWLTFLNRPQRNLERAHEWANAAVIVCEWADGLIHREAS